VPACRPCRPLRPRPDHGSDSARRPAHLRGHVGAGRAERVARSCRRRRLLARHRGHARRPRGLAARAPSLSRGGPHRVWRDCRAALLGLPPPLPARRERPCRRGRRLPGEEPRRLADLGEDDRERASAPRPRAAADELGENRLRSELPAPPRQANEPHRPRPPSERELRPPTTVPGGSADLRPGREGRHGGRGASAASAASRPSRKTLTSSVPSRSWTAVRSSTSTVVRSATSSPSCRPPMRERSS
jgi:hypothetical protein